MTCLSVLLIEALWDYLSGKSTCRTMFLQYLWWNTPGRCALWRD